jgi:hypothetical protein
MRKATTNSICRAYADKGVRITVKPVPKAPELILFEGDALAFEFLGKLFLAHSQHMDGCGLQMGPKYAGRSFFSKKTTLGIYLHRLPCDNDILTADHSAYKKKKAGAQK